MTSLGPEGRALIESSRRALRPTAADRERVEAALRARLGEQALPPDAGQVPVPVRAAWRFVPTAAATVCLLGGALLFAVAPKATKSVQQTGVSEHPSDAAVASPSVTNDPSDEQPVLNIPTATSVPASTTPGDSPSASRPRSDRLAQEVVLLSSAASALNAGRPADALKTLETHRRRFPRGLLTEERRAARAQALCLLGRSHEGRIELRQLAPRSPARSSATRVCEAAARSETERSAPSTRSK